MSSYCVKDSCSQKPLVTIPLNHVVPLKILNPTDEVVSIPKGSILSDLHLLNKDYDIIMDSDKTCKTSPVNVVNNVFSVQNFGQNKSDSSVFFDEFKISETLSLDQQEKLSDCLLQNRDIFVTKENPNLGYTTAVQHKIILKSDAQPKHRKPYRLPPHKREVLRHHLDELLRQGIIAPVSENEDVPITSPIVLVTKRAKSRICQIKMQLCHNIDLFAISDFLILRQWNSNIIFQI